MAQYQTGVATGERDKAREDLSSALRAVSQYQTREAQYIRDFNSVRLYMKGEEENGAIYDILNRVPRAAK
jgi:hypothetical protein